MKINKIIRLFLLLFFFAESNDTDAQNLRADGYKGIWFTLGQFSEYGDKATGDRLQASGSITTFPITVGSIKSPLFSINANGKEIFTEQYKTYHYSYFEAQSAFFVTVTSQETISEIKISPQKFNISAKTGSNETSFTLPGPGYYVVRINQKHKLFIFADAPENKPVPTGINVVDLGIDNKGQRIETKAIQEALNSVSGTGKTLVFPAGIYKTGSLSISSNTKIYLSAGAILKAVDDISAFDFKDNVKPKSYIRIKDAQNVEISGRGIIDANGWLLRDKYADTARMRLLLILNSKKINVSGIFIRDPGSWNTHILFSEDVILHDIKMLNDIELSNTDGFDPDASKRVLIENCFAYCSDDNVAVKTTGSSDYLQDVEDITVKGCVFLTKKSSLKVGTESRSEKMSNILFEDNDVIESDRGMALYCSDGALYENIRFINNRFEDNHPDAKQCGINFTINKRNSNSQPGQIKGAIVKDCSFAHPFPKSSEILGFDENHRIQITFENLQIAGIKCKTLEEAKIKSNEFADIGLK